MRQIIFAILVSLLVTSPALAQSGRRGATKTTTTTAPSVSGPKEVEKKATPQPKIQLLVGITGRSVFTNDNLDLEGNDGTASVDHYARP